jgi:hypothetical protein
VPRKACFDAETLRVSPCAFPSVLTGSGNDMVSNTIDFHYIKSGEFRCFHVDGAVGAISANGNVVTTFFLERNAIPQVQTFELAADGQLGKKITEVGKSGIVRELECGVIMSLATAKKLHELLGKQIAKLDERTGAIETSAETK